MKNVSKSKNTYYKSHYFSINELKENKNKIHDINTCARISTNVKNFQNLEKTLFINKNIFSTNEVLSLSFHLSSPEDVIEMESLSCKKSIKNLVMIFNGFPIFKNYNFYKELDLHNLTINMNLEGFIMFWKELPYSVRIMNLNIYLHLNSYNDFKSLFIIENNIMKNIYIKVDKLTRNKSLEGLNLNILFNSTLLEEKEEMAELKLKNYLYYDYKYYLGFLELFSINLIVNADKSFFIFSGLNSKFTQEKEFQTHDKFLEMSLKLYRNTDVSILYTLKKKKLKNRVAVHVFKFLAKKQYTIVNISQQYYKIK